MLRSLENDGGPEALPAYHGGRRMSTTSLSSSHLKKVSKQSARKTKTYGDGTYGGSVQSKDSAGSDSGFGKKKKRRKSRKSVNAVGPAMGRRRSHGVSGKKGRGKKNKNLYSILSQYYTTSFVLCSVPRRQNQAYWWVLEDSYAGLLDRFRIAYALEFL